MAALEFWRDNIDHFSLTPRRRSGKCYWIMDDVGRKGHWIEDEEEWRRLEGEMRAAGVKVFEETRDWSEYTRTQWVAFYATLGDLIAYDEDGEVRPSLSNWIEATGEESASWGSSLLLSWLYLSYAGIHKGPQELPPEVADDIGTMLRMLAPLGWIFSIENNQLDFRPTVDENHRKALLQYVWDVSLHCPSDVRSLRSEESHEASLLALRATINEPVGSTE